MSIPVLSPGSVSRLKDFSPAVTDAQLLRAAAAGDNDSFEALYLQHADLIRSRLRRRCDDRELAEEVLQDTFLAVWRGAGRWDGSGPVPAWIWGIAVRRLADARRRLPPDPSDAAGCEQTTASAEDDVLDALQYGNVGEALNQLAPELRLVIHATILLQLSTQEAARVLGIPSGTVKTRMMRARSKLRQALVACPAGTGDHPHAE